MKKQYLEMARLTKTIGLKGEMRAQIYCDSEQMLLDFETLYLGKEKTPVRVESVRAQKNNMAAVRLSGTETVEQAEKLCGKIIYLDRNDAELPEGTYFIDDLIGMSVIDADDGRVYGKVNEILQNGATDVYSIKTPSGKELLFPAIPDVLLDIDTKRDIITIRPLPNLFELEDEIDEENDEN